MGGGDCLRVAPSPPAAAHAGELGSSVDHSLLGVVARPEGVAHLPAGLLPFRASVRRYHVGQPSQVGGQSIAGVAELVDAEGERFVRAGTVDDDLRPVVVQLVMEAGDLVPAPALGCQGSPRLPTFFATLVPPSCARGLGREPRSAGFYRPEQLVRRRRRGDSKLCCTPFVSR